MSHFDQQQTLRVLDANANRAAEGLRTLEDFARLVAEDGAAVQRLKKLRHRLADVLRDIDRRERLAARNTADDAGTAITTGAEQQRESLSAVVQAAVERVQQSLRGLEEFSKLISIDTSAHIKQLRYEAYDFLAQLELQLLPAHSFAAPQLYLLIDCRLELEMFRHYLRDLANAGVDWFQIRDKQADGRRLVDYTRAAIEVLRETSARVIVNDRVDVALACGAAGVHVGQDDLRLEDVRRLLASQMSVGVSTHDMTQAREAYESGADYIGCGPTFPSRTKCFESFAGLDFLRAVGGEIAIPYFAIGGIDSGNVDQVLACGCRRIAVSAAIHAAGDPCAAARRLKTLLG